MLALNNEIQMPSLGLGVFQSSSEENVTAVSTALANGYRLIDTTVACGIEKEISDATVRSTSIACNRTQVREDARASRAALASLARVLRHPKVPLIRNAFAENISVFDFALTADEVAAIDALDTGVRGGAGPQHHSPDVCDA
jgi:diketogulonate reductase-like aldo/keto reductase